MNNSIKFSMDTLSVNTVTRKLTALRSAVTNGGLAGVNSIAERIYDTAEATCPASTGSLKSTLYKEAEATGNVIEANVGHGGKYDTVNPTSGENVDSYAIEVHENVNKTNSKWLEKAFNAESSNSEQIIGNHIKAALGG